MKSVIQHYQIWNALKTEIQSLICFITRNVKTKDVFQCWFLGQFGRAQNPATHFNYFMWSTGVLKYFMHLVAFTALFRAHFWFLSFSVHGERIQNTSIDNENKRNFINQKEENVAKFVNQSSAKNQFHHLIMG